MHYVLHVIIPDFISTTEIPNVIENMLKPFDYDCNIQRHETYCFCVNRAAFLESRKEVEKECGKTFKELEEGYFANEGAQTVPYRRYIRPYYVLVKEKMEKHPLYQKPDPDCGTLTPIQAFMGQKIAKIRGIDIKEEGAMEVIKFIAGMVGLGFAAQQTAIGLFKMGLPGLGGFITIPLVAGLTYGIGKAVDLYFKNKAIGRTPSKEEIIQAFRQGKREGKKIKQDDLKNIEVVNVDGKNKETY